MQAGSEPMPTPTPMVDALNAEDDAALLKRYAASGDRAAMDALFRRHTAAAYRLAKYIAKNPADAEEIVQNVFLDVLRTAPSYRGDASVKTWILQMIANKSISRLREESRRKQREQTALAQRPIETASDKSAEHAVVREHLAQLPDHYRLPIYLRYMEGMSTKEVAMTLLVNEKTVYSQIERGIAQLQRSLTLAGITTAGMVLPTMLATIALEAPPPALAQVISTLVAQTPLPSLATTAAPHFAKAALSKTALVFGAASLTILAAGGGVLWFTHQNQKSTLPIATNSAVPQPVKLASLPLAANGLVIQNHVAFCISATENKIYAIDVADPKSPRIRAILATKFAEPNAIQIENRFIYVTERGNGGRLEVLDVANPDAPVSVSSMALSSGAPLALAVQGNRALVLQDDGAELGVYDLADRSAPKAVGSARIDSPVTSLRVQGNFVYVSGLKSNAGYLAVFELADDGKPSLAGSSTGWQYPNHFLPCGNYGYWPSGNHKLIVVDLSKPATPTLINGVGPGFNGPRASVSSGRLLWVADRPTSGNDQLQTFDLASPSSPVFLHTIDLGSSNTRSLVVDGSTLFVVNGSALTTFDLGTTPAEKQ